MTNIQQDRRQSNIFSIVMVLVILLCSIMTYFIFFNYSYEYPEEKYQLLQNIIHDSFDSKEKTIHFSTDIPKDINFEVNSDSSNIVLSASVQNTSTKELPIRYGLTLSKDFTIVKEGRNFSSPESYRARMLMLNILFSFLIGIILPFGIDIIVVFLYAIIKVFLHPIFSSNEELSKKPLISKLATRPHHTIQKGHSKRYHLRSKRLPTIDKW